MTKPGAHVSPETRERSRLTKTARYADPIERQKILSNNHKGRYGITLEEKEAMFEAQGRACAVCRTTEPVGNGWHTDHDHACCSGSKACGKCVRGVVCMHCNMAAGLLKDDPELARALAEYMMAGLSAAGQPNLRSAVTRKIPA